MMRCRAAGRSPWALTAPLVACVALAAVCATSRERMDWLYVNTGFYAMMALACYLGWVLKRAVPAAGLRLWPGLRWAVFGVGMAAVVFAAVRPQLRIVSDETNLLGIGRAMAEEHRVIIASQGTLRNGVFTPLEYTVADRPLLQPLALSILDMAFGYHMWTAFALNFALLATLLAGAAAAASRRLGPGAGVGGALLLLAQPLVPLTAASAIYDLMNAWCLAAAAVALLRYLEAPSGAALAVVWTMLLCALHVRHESAVFLPVVGAGLLLSRRVTWPQVREYLGLYLATPLLLLPRAVELALYSGMLAPAHQNTTQIQASVSLDNLKLNLYRFMTTFRSFDLTLPYATWVNIAGLAALPALAWTFGRRDRRGAWFAFAAITAAALLAHLTVTAAYWGSNATYPITARYFLPTCLGLSAAAYGGLALLPARIRRGLVPAAGLAAWGFYFPVATRATNALSEPAIRKLNFVTSELAALARDRLLVVADFPGRYTAQGYGAVSFDYFARHRAELTDQHRQGVLRDVLFVQEFAVPSLVPFSNSMLAPDVPLVPLTTAALYEDSQVRISRLGP